MLERGLQRAARLNGLYYYQRREYVAGEPSWEDASNICLAKVGALATGRLGFPNMDFFIYIFFK